MTTFVDILFDDRS